MPNVASEILEFCKNPNLRNRVDEIIAHSKPTEEEKKEIIQFFDRHIVELYKNALEFSIITSDMDLMDDEKEEIEQQFLGQLNYWWLEIQSEWIRFNNLLNYKLAIKQERDTVLSVKASICTFFLSPVSKFLNVEELEVNINFLKSLITRSQYEGLYAEISSDKKKTEIANNSEIRISNEKAAE